LLARGVTPFHSQQSLIEPDPICPSKLPPSVGLVRPSTDCVLGSVLRLVPASVSCRRWPPAPPLLHPPSQPFQRGPRVFNDKVHRVPLWKCVNPFLVCPPPAWTFFCARMALFSEVLIFPPAPPTASRAVFGFQTILLQQQGLSSSPFGHASANSRHSSRCTPPF